MTHFLLLSVDLVVPVAQLVEHCVSCANVHGFDSQGTHRLIKCTP